MLDFYVAKISNKNQFSIRRRSVTRKSGFKSHPESTGGTIKYESIIRFILKKDETLFINFDFPNHQGKKFVGYGAYFFSNSELEININNENFNRNCLKNYGKNIWGKFGSIWQASEKVNKTIVIIKSQTDTEISLYDVNCGIIDHNFLDINNDLYKKIKNIKEEQELYFEKQISNLWTYAPESNFYTKKGKVLFNKKFTDYKNIIPLKICNRCARYLPVNLGDNQRSTLSFSNHCGESKNGCTHKGFGILFDKSNNKIINLEFGFQLECRFCKKFAVNAALNYQRTSAQMKEDGQRRRHFELLLAELYKSSPLLSYRVKMGSELTNDIFNKFKKKCFKCKIDLTLKKGENRLNLDHTRPLSLLWQLDDTATALCKNCNSAKRDKYPVDFYTNKQLLELSKITGISIKELENPSPNEIALDHLIENFDWFFNTFLKKKELEKIKQGKRSDELICKALDKVMKKSLKKRDFSFLKHFSAVFAKQDTDAV